MDCEDISTSHCHFFRTHHVFLSSRSRSPSNLITVNRLPFNKISNSLLSLCLLNSFASVTQPVNRPLVEPFPFLAIFFPKQRACSQASVTLILSLLRRLCLTIKMTQFEQNFVQMDTSYWMMLTLIGKEAVQLLCSGTCSR